MTGLVAASVLHSQGLKRILVIDEYARIGGNHIDCQIGPYSFDIGTMIFQDDSPLMAHFPELLPLYHPVTVDISRITPGGSVCRYPFSFRDDVAAAGPFELVMLLASLIWARLPPVRITNAEDYVQYWIGPRFFERSGLANYIERFYGAKASQIDRIFAEKRMSNIAYAASLGTRIARLFGARKLHNTKQEFVRPRAGFALLYDAARQSLMRKGTRFALGTRVESVTRNGALFRVTTEGLSAVSDSVFATIPLPRALEVCGLPPTGDLPVVELVSLFFSFKGRRGFSSNVLYNFSATGRWKRLTMYSDFFGPAQGREYFTVEVNWVENGLLRPAEGLISSLVEDFTADIGKKGLFDGSLTLEGSHRLQNGYPIYRKDATAAAAAAIESLRVFGIKSFGRQGGFDYLPTARQATLAAEESLRL